MVRQISLACAAIATIFIGSYDLNGQAAAPGSGESRITIKLVNVSFEEVIFQLGYKHGIYVGLEKSALDSNVQELEFKTNMSALMAKIDSGELKAEPDIQPFRDSDAKERMHSFSIDVENAEVDDVAGLIAKQLPDYDFEYSNGLINFHPVKARSSAISDFLDIEIRELTISDKTEVWMLPGIIANVPEVKTFLARNGLQLKGSIASGATNLLEIMYDRPVDSGGLRLTNVSLKEVLNKIGRAKKGGWVISIKNSRIELDI